MARSRSSQRWLTRQKKDPFVKQVTRHGYRSRARFKLEAIQKRDHLIQPGMLVLDLGCAPGGWSELARELVGPKGRVIGIDCLDMKPLVGMVFLQGDFTDPAFIESLDHVCANQTVDVVLSDMAPSFSGVRHVDQMRCMTLSSQAFDFSRRILKPDGACLIKAFQGEDFEDFFRAFKLHFNRVCTRKPDSSRAASRELYLLGEGSTGKR